MTERERRAALAVARMRETRANPFRQPRRANGEARYLNRRQERMNRTAFDRDGNPTGAQQ